MIKPVRLDKWLSSQGFGSRSDTQKLVRKGSVQVDNQVVLSPQEKIKPASQKILVHHQPVTQAFHHHLMLYKPKGHLTAASDLRQPTVMDLLPSTYKKNHCMPVGRLDKDTTGLLLFTTDGTLAHFLLSPKKEVLKTYDVIVEGELTEEDCIAFSERMDLGDFVSLPAHLTILHSSIEQSSAQVTIYEGKYHQVKRMFGYIKKPVLSLHRSRFGSISLDPALAPGDFRPLTEIEVASLWNDVGKGALLDD